MTIRLRACTSRIRPITRPVLKIRIVQWPTAARLTRVAAVLLVALAPLAPLAPGALGVAQAQTAASKRPIERGPLVTAVDLRGVKHMDPKVLSLAILTRDSECRTLLYAPICLLTKSSQFYERHYLDALELRRDVLRLRLFYWRRGYRDTRVVTRTVPSSGGVRVIFDITEGPPTIVDQITVRGVDSIIPRRIVQATLQLKDNEPLDLLLLDSSAVKLRDEFFQRGYADAAIELDTGRVSDAANHGPVALIVHHGARNTVKAIEIEGNSRISERTIRRLLTFKAGDLYRRNSILESQRNLYLSGMFAEVEMRTPPPDSMAHVAQQRDSATAVVALSDSVRRDTAARDSVIRDTVARRSVRRDTVARVTTRSDSLNTRAARRDTTNGAVTDARSFATDSARRARRLRLLVADTTKIVRLRVTEAQLHRLDLTGGFSTADFAQFEAALTRYNFWGAARRVTLRGTLANIGASQLSGSGPFYDVANGTEGSTRNAFLSPIWATSLDFTQPWFLSPRNQLGASLFAHRRTIPGIAIDRGKGATIALTREHGPRVSTTLGYTYEASTVDASDVYFCVTFGVCVRSSISAVSRGNAIAPIALATIIDQSDNALSPSNGYRARIELEHASAYTLSDFRYNRIALTGTRYIRMSARNVLAGRIRLGWVNALGTTADALNVTGASGEEVIHPRKRFFAGGSQSVRGFGENQLGPRVLTVAPEKFTKAPNDTTPALCTVQQLRNLTCDPNSARLSASDFAPQPLGGTSIAEGSIEFRFPLRFYTGLSGALFVDGALIGTDRFSSILGATGAVTPGFGFRLSTPVGPVRLDLGVRPTLSERLPVITQVADSLGNATLVTLKTTRQYSPVDASGNILRQILGRLTLHLSVGPAF